MRKRYWGNRIVKKAFLSIKSYIIRNKPLSITVAFAIGAFIGWVVCSERLNLGDLFLNLLAGFIASILTISIIDHILKCEHEKNTLPLKLSLYRDVQLFTSRIIGLWQEMYVQSIESRSEIAIEELFSENTINAIYDCLDLEGKPNVIPAQDWFLYIDNNLSEIQKCGEIILDRYISVAPPELLQSIHHLISDSAFAGFGLKVLNRVRAFDLRKRIPRLPMLRAYAIFPSERDFAEIDNLLKWCNKNYDELSGKSSTVYHVSQRVTIVNPHVPPSSIISKDKIEGCAINYEKWVNSSPQIH